MTSLCLSLTCAVQLLAVPAELPVEAPLGPGATALEEPNRYQSPRSYDETLDFYRRLFNQTGGVRWRTVVNLPGIKAKHVESLRKKTRWEGLNIYDKQGQVRIYVLYRQPPEGPPPARSKSKGPH